MHLQATEHLPGSAELWFLRVTQLLEAKADQAEILDTLETAVASAGLHWDSKNLWSLYIMCLTDFGDITGALSVYRRAVRVPAAGVKEHITNLQQFLVAHAPEEKEAVIEEVSKSVSDLLMEVERRIKFESCLENVHPNKSTKGEISSYVEYIEYLKQSGSSEEVRLVYERCLARSCREEELWLQWAAWEQGLEAGGRLESVLQRGILCLPRSTALHYIAAEHKEEIGEYEEANELLLKMAIQKPESSARLKIVHLAIRMGQDKESVTELYVKAYHEMSDPKQASEIILKLAKYLQAQGCSKNAIHYLDQGLENNMKFEAESHNSRLYFTKLEIMKSVEPVQVIEICNNAMNSKIDDASKMKFAEEKIDMAQTLGASLHLVKRAEKELSVLRDKCADKGCKSSSGEPPEKKLKKFVCDKCSEKFITFRTLTNHQRIMHSCREKCERCDIIFEDKHMFVKHKQSKTCFWKCEHCKYKSLKYSDVAKHVKSVHKNKIAGILPLGSSIV